MTNAIQRFTGPSATSGAIVPYTPPAKQGAAPVINNLLNFIAEQVAKFSQSHLHSQANTFATKHGLTGESQHSNLEKTLRDFAKQFAAELHPGRRQGAATKSGAKRFDPIKQKRAQAEKDIQEIKAHAEIDAMVNAAKAEAKRAKETRDWILQNL